MNGEPAPRRLISRGAAVVRRLARRFGYTPRRPTLSLKFETVEDFAGFATDARAHVRYAVLDIDLKPWFPVRPDWQGTLGAISGVRSCRAEFHHGRQRAHARVEVDPALPGHDLVRAAFEIFYPTRPTTGWGGKRVAVLADAPPDLLWQPGGGLRPLPARRAPKQRFAEYDVVICADGDRVTRDPAQPPLLVPRPVAPTIMINPKVHRPLERPQPSADTRSATAVIESGKLLIRSGPEVLVSRPADVPLTATDLRRLVGVTDIDLSGMGTEASVSHRVAELAAYGAVLHDGAPQLRLDPTLAGLAAAPFTPCGLLDHMSRSLAQVRAVMHNHTRAFACAQLPSISVILSCQRATLLERILEQMAAQDHPQVEVVLGCHGFPAPARESFSPAVQARLGPILEFDRDVIFGDVLAALSAASSGDFISKVDDDDWYGPRHLSDLYMAWVYSEAQLVGRKLALVHFESSDRTAVRSFFLEGYRWQVAGGASLISRHDLAAVGGWRSQVRAVDRGLWSRLMDAGGVNYACSGPGYVHTRHSSGHTWSVSDRYFLENYTAEVLPGLPPAALGAYQLAQPQLSL